MTDTAHPIDPQRQTGSGRATESLMLFTFAVICASVGGLLHLAAELPASTATLAALASMSIVIAANAMVRRRTAIGVLNAQIAELRMEINGLRSARAAAPLNRPQAPTGAVAPGGEAPPARQPREGTGTRGTQPAPPSSHARTTAPPPMGPVSPASPFPRSQQQYPAPGATQAAAPAGPRQPPAPGMPPSSAPPQMDWTLRPGVHREPTIRIPANITLPMAPGASGPLPLMPAVAAHGRAEATSASQPGPSQQTRSTSNTKTVDGEAVRRDMPPVPPGPAAHQPPPRPGPAAPGAPASPGQPQASAHPTPASSIDDLIMPRPDDAPRAMSQSGGSAWPRVVPKTPTSPLDLDTMQNLIEQLAGQLDQDPALVDANKPARPDAAPRDGHAAASPARDRAMADAASSRGRPAPATRATPSREPAPFGHIALIAEAVEAKRMDVMLDPILGLSDRRARHFELSVRLLTEQGDSLEAAQYAPVAAGTGLLGRIDAEKLSRAADVLQRLRARGSAASIFSTVAGESLHDDTFARTFAGVLEAEEGNALRLVLSFEQAEARNFTEAHWHAIADMSRIGVKFALTGVTDLDMDFETLKRRGFDFIKLDAHVFLEGLPTPSGIIPASDICRHLAGMGLGLIVGGIVEEKDLARILGFGVLLGQGALFGGPRSVELERERRAA